MANFSISIGSFSFSMSFGASASKVQELETQNAALKAALEKAYHHPVFGCLNRLGLEAKAGEGRLGQWAVAVDIDRMHSLNSVVKYHGTDACIRELLSYVRKDEGATAQWLSGDEFLILVDSEESARTVAERLLAVCQDITTRLRTEENLLLCEEAHLSDSRVVPASEFGFGCTMYIQTVPRVNTHLKEEVDKVFTTLSNEKGVKGLRGQLLN